MPAAIGGLIGLSGIAASIVGGAIIGAAIGGLTAAITGGDIGSGILFGAVGGAVGGAITYGVSAALNGIGTGAINASAETAISGSGFWEAAIASGSEVTVGTTGIATSVVDTAVGSASSGFFDGVMGELSGSLGAEAVSAGIKGVGDIYMQGKAGEQAEEMMAKEQEYWKEQAGISQQHALEQIAASGGGSGGSGSEMSLEDRLAIISAEGEQSIASIRAEIEGQSKLKQMEFDEISGMRELSAATAGALSAGRGTESRSDTSLTDIQDSIREGESPTGEVNAEVVPNVVYVTPEDQARRAALQGVV